MRRTLLLLTLALMSAGSCAASAQTPVVRVEGTTNLAPLLTQAAATFQAGHPHAQLAVKGTSSGAGIAALRDGTIDVAASDIAVNEPGFVDTTLGAVGFSFVANQADGVHDLSRAQIIGIFSGKITNWKAVGGADVPIVIISRDIGTGTRLVLEQKVAKTLIPTQVVANADAVMGKVEHTPGAIGYVASYFVGDRTDLVVTYNGIAPTVQTIKDHTYAFSTDEHLYVRSAASASARSFVAAVAADHALLRHFGIY